MSKQSFDVEYTETVEADTHIDAAKIVLKRIRETKDALTHLYVKREGQDSDHAHLVGIPTPVNYVGELYSALAALVERYTDLVDSGDAGNWDAEKEPQIIAARNVLAKVEQS